MELLNERKLLFNETGEREWSKRRIVGGNPTNIMELTNVKYEWATRLADMMLKNFWMPEEVSLLSDAKEYLTLSQEEQWAYDRMLSFVIFMDSLLTVSMPNLINYVTAPEINLCLSIHNFHEALHSKSYGYVLESVLPAERRQPIYDLWREDRNLLERNRYIANTFQQFADHPTDANFVRACMAQYVLEGIYFYSGFAFFYALSRLGKMIGTATEIKFINRDEITHVAVFQNLLNGLRKERPELFTAAFDAELRGMIRQAAEHEMAWAAYCVGERIQGLSATLLQGYVKHSADQRARALGLEPLFGNHPNPIKWVESFANLNETKADFFETRVTNYAKSGNLQLDDL
ncbi:MAG: ribonucleoside-diphosphate reductase beta subunit [Firmicutes bacterium]|nr:ribonucleoside-diphosphate reductase beta subunit [Bacillota bacterium]